MIVKALAIACAAAVTGLSVGVDSGATPRRSSGCPGDFRWPVKTLSDRNDRFVDFRPQGSYVEEVRKFPRPPGIGPRTPRMRNQERQVFRVGIRLVESRLATTGDIVLIGKNVIDPRVSIALEFPDPTCDGAARSAKRRAMRRARAAFIRECGMPGRKVRYLGYGVATVTGVGYFDSLKGPAAVAPNGFELHPVLSFSTPGCNNPPP